MNNYWEEHCKTCSSGKTCKNCVGCKRTDGLPTNYAMRIKCTSIDGEEYKVNGSVNDGVETVKI